VEPDRAPAVLPHTFTSAEQLEQMVAMGMEEGMRLAMGQTDALLADAPH
jgi:hypothetical protein